jgi:hypothetical protein
LEPESADRFLEEETAATAVLPRALACTQEILERYAEEV